MENFNLSFRGRIDVVIENLIYREIFSKLLNLLGKSRVFMQILGNSEQVIIFFIDEVLIFFLDRVNANEET